MSFRGTCSKKGTFQQGLPQGSVISPVLFLMYIDDLPESITGDVQTSLFADDVACFVQDRSLEAAQERIQGAVDAVSKWSARWKLQLSAEKCECAFFSTNSHGAKWRPSITIEGRPLKYNPTPTFLGIKYDRQLTFGGHVEEVTKKVKRRAQAIRKLGNTD